MIKIVAAIAALIGIVIGWNIQQVRINWIERGIEQTNREAAATLEQATKRVRELEERAALANNELDKANESSIATINAYHDKLRDAVSDRVRAATASRCRGAVPKGGDTVLADQDRDDSADIPDGFGEFLADQAKRADTVAAYAETCRRFVFDNRCGIKQ